MRKILRQQLHLHASIIDHEHARELQQMSLLLDECAEALKLVHADLIRDVTNPEDGREGMLSAEQVLRAVVVKQMNEWSYEELAFHLNDSVSNRAFCHFGIGDEVPSTSTLCRDIKSIRAETLECINRLLLKDAKQQGIEKGRKVRCDCTVEESNIHAPTDSWLLWDCVRTLTRLMHRAEPSVEIRFTDHSRRAKRRAIGIEHAKTKAKRKPLYKDLLKVTEKTVSYAHAVATALDKCFSIATEGLATELRHYIELTGRVIDQTRRRVLQDESVPASEKIVSIFEPHTDIIVKDRRDTYYGHKLCLTTGASALVLDCVIEEGNPADSSLAVKMVERQINIYDRPPRQASFDGGFASKENLTDINERLKVKDVCFSKCRYLKVTDMVKSSWVYRKLRRFRAGIEGGISFLKRCFGLDRCTWKGLDSFKAYTWASVLSHNLLVLARHALT